MNKYQEALNKIIRSCCPYCYDDNGCQNCEIKQTCNATAKSWVDTLQELVDEKIPLTPEYKNTKVEREHYLDKDYQMLYHCPKCYWIINPVREYCEHCGQKLNWNKYYVVEGDTYYKRNE